MEDNPNPNRITNASWRYIEARRAMDPGDVVYAGSYVNKPGYHGTRLENQARDQVDGRADYSVRLPQDLLGPNDKTAAYDFKYLSAAAGDYRAMARRGAAVRKAFLVRDPRFFGWREYLGQGDPDKAPEGFDFVTWTERVPDPTHEWHDHESELREFVESWDNKACMLSVLAEETLGAYLRRGGRLLPGAPLPPGFTIEEETMLMLAKDPQTGQHWLCDGMQRRPIAAEDVDDIRHLGASGAISLFAGKQAEAPNGIWLAVSNIMGLPVASTTTVDVQALATAIVAKLPVTTSLTPADRAALAADVRTVVVDVLLHGASTK
jgi:hypothetical protein